MWLDDPLGTCFQIGFEDVLFQTFTTIGALRSSSMADNRLLAVGPSLPDTSLWPCLPSRWRLPPEFKVAADVGARMPESRRDASEFCTALADMNGGSQQKAMKSKCMYANG
jgi:hypothetical protein